MSERAYSRLANAFMLIGIASALLFDSGIFPHVLVGTIGVLAGVAAVALYFWNQSEVKKDKKSTAKAEAISEHVVPEQISNHGARKRLTLEMDESARAALLELSLYKSASSSIVGKTAREFWLSCDEDRRAIQAYRKETAKIFLRNYAAHQARTLQWHMVKNANMALMKPEVELSVNEVAVCAAEIMRNLALIDDVDSWDYTFGPKGLHVSMKRTKSARPVVSQEDFDFDLINSLPV